MNRILFSVIIIATIFVGGCTILAPAMVKVGDSEHEVIAKLGKPTNHYQDGNNRLLEYARVPMGQETYMARMDSDGRLMSYEQVLTTEKFSTIKIDVATKLDVLRLIGRPSETSYLTLSDLEVWSYPYKESGIWNSIMHVHFDKTGKVRKLLNSPDLRFETELPWSRHMLR